MRIRIINGPNLNLLGTREPQVYGNMSFDQYLTELRTKFRDLEVDYFQSNIEGTIIDALQESAQSFDGVILNAGAYTHTSVAIGDTVAAIPIPVVEVHISNVFKREEFRHQSYISAHAAGIIVGFGLRSYELALHYFYGNK